MVACTLSRPSIRPALFHPLVPAPAGVMIMGGCATVLAMQFANNQLLGMDTASGKAFR